MAVVGEAPVVATARGGWLSSLALSQYSALAAMRWSMFRHGLRSTKGAVELGARALIILIYSVMGLGLATGLGAGAIPAVAYVSIGRALPEDLRPRMFATG